MGRKLRQLHEFFWSQFEYFSTSDWVCFGGSLSCEVVTNTSWEYKKGFNKGGMLHGASHFNSYVNPNVYSNTQSLNLIQIKKQEKKQPSGFLCAW